MKAQSYPASNTCALGKIHLLSYRHLGESRQHLVSYIASMSKVICVLACIALVQSCAAFDWKQCADTAGKINNVKLTPEAPSPGSTVTFNIDATVGTCSSHQAKALFLLLMLSWYTLMLIYTPGSGTPQKSGVHQAGAELDVCSCRGASRCRGPQPVCGIPWLPHLHRNQGFV